MKRLRILLMACIVAICCSLFLTACDDSNPADSGVIGDPPMDDIITDDAPKTVLL